MKLVNTLQESLENCKINDFKVSYATYLSLSEKSEYDCMFKAYMLLILLSEDRKNHAILQQSLCEEDLLNDYIIVAEKANEFLLTSDCVKLHHLIEDIKYSPFKNLLSVILQNMKQEMDFVLKKEQKVIFNKQNNLKGLIKVINNNFTHA